MESSFILESRLDQCLPKLAKLCVSNTAEFGRIWADARLAGQVLDNFRTAVPPIAHVWSIFHDFGRPDVAGIPDLRKSGTSYELRHWNIVLNKSQNMDHANNDEIMGPRSPGVP